MKFVGTVTDRSWIRSLPESLGIEEKARMLHDVRHLYGADYLLLWRVHKAQLHRVYLDEYKNN